ncbi:MAG: hypothetical protein ACRDJ1_09845 [Actinomycetota bacterium]
MSAVGDVLNREFDLRHRPQPGDTSRYRMEACYRLLDGQGQVRNTDSYVGEFQRVCEPATTPGVTSELITWTNVIKRWATEDQPYEAPEAIDWAEGFSYRFTSAMDFPELNAEILRNAPDFPRDLIGWNILLLAIDAHVEFDLPRTTPAEVGKLKRVGDEVLITFDGESVIEFGPLRAVFQAVDHFNRFTALTLDGGALCGILESDIPSRVPLTMHMDGHPMEGSSSLVRKMVIRAEDGALQSGTSIEFVCTDGMWINSIYSIEPLS